MKARGVGSPVARLTSGHKLPIVGAENQIPALCKSNTLLTAKPSLQSLQPN